MRYAMALLILTLVLTTIRSLGADIPLWVVFAPLWIPAGMWLLLVTAIEYGKR